MDSINRVMVKRPKESVFNTWFINNVFSVISRSLLNPKLHLKVKMLKFSTRKKLVAFQCKQTRPIQSNKTEKKSNLTQSNSNRSIGLGNRTKSNTYFAVSSIFEPTEPI